MRKNLIIAVLIFSAAIIIFGGCSDRGYKKPTAPTYGTEWGLWPDISAAFRTSSGSATAPAQLLFQIRNPESILKLEVYVPKEAWPAPEGGGQRVPLLVLLAPEGGDRYFYSDRGLYELADEMVAKGEIQPMIIVTVANDPTFNGYFYGNSYPAGLYDGIIADTVDYWDTDFGDYTKRGLIGWLYMNEIGELLVDSPDKRGIAGVGQGAYGAFRAILKHPGVYNSISVADGPLSFNDGLTNLFAQAEAEQRANWATIPDAGDFNANFTINDFDTSYTMPISDMFVGGSLAFSPWVYELFYQFDNQTRPTVGDPAIVDSAYGYDLGPESLNTALIGIPSGDWDFYLPFSVQNGTFVKNDNVWALWEDNDLPTMLDANPTALDQVSIFVATSAQAHWGYHDMTNAWISKLGTNVDEVYQYQGYGGNPATDNQYMYDLMKRWLKFHSDNFETN